MRVRRNYIKEKIFSGEELTLQTSNSLKRPLVHPVTCEKKVSMEYSASKMKEGFLNKDIYESKFIHK